MILERFTFLDDRASRLRVIGVDHQHRVTGFGQAFAHEAERGPRQVFHYLNDGGMPVGFRVGDWKIVYKEQRSHGVNVWIDPWTTLRAPKLFNLRMDPFERMDHESGQYAKWWTERMFLFAPSAVKVGEFMKTFEEYPQRQKPASWVIE